MSRPTPGHALRELAGTGASVLTLPAHERVR
jgi:hypothetical protein